MPPLTPEQLREMTVRSERLAIGLEETVLEDVSRRIAKAGSAADASDRQLTRLREEEQAGAFLEKAAADHTRLSENEIRQVFFEAAQVSDDFYSEVYKKAGREFSPFSENEYVQKLISAGIEHTSDELKGFTGAMGFSVPSHGGSVKFKPIAEAYRDAIDTVRTQVSAGVFDRDTAVRKAVGTFAESGLRFADPETGQAGHADAAVRRVVLAGVSQMLGEIALHNAEELGTDLVEVTAHAGARPEHAAWQGRWYSLSGKSQKYKSLAEATGYGTGEGLKGWNCRHDFYPVIEGIDTPSYTEEELANIDPPPIEYDGKTYTYCECARRQRRIEAAMRKTRREIVSARGAGDDEQFTVKSVLLRRQREEYEKFSSAAGLLTRGERARVYGVDRSVAERASLAAFGALDKSGGSGIIKLLNTHTPGDLFAAIDFNKAQDSLNNVNAEIDALEKKLNGLYEDSTKNPILSSDSTGFYDSDSALNKTGERYRLEGEAALKAAEDEKAIRDQNLKDYVADLDKKKNLRKISEQEKRAKEQEEAEKKRINDSVTNLKDRLEVDKNYTEEMYYNDLEALISTLDKESDLYKKFDSEILKGRRKLADNKEKKLLDEQNKIVEDGLSEILKTYEKAFDDLEKKR